MTGPMSAPTDPRDDSPAARPAVAFDERLWPVAAALVILAALGGAAIWRVSDFHDPRWWANGWTYLGSLTGVTLLLILAMSLVGRARRALQLAAILSVLLHLGIFLSLHQYRLRADADDQLASRHLPDPVEEFLRQTITSVPPTIRPKTLKSPWRRRFPSNSLKKSSAANSRRNKSFPTRASRPRCPAKRPTSRPRSCRWKSPNKRRRGWRRPPRSSAA